MKNPNDDQNACPSARTEEIESQLQTLGKLFDQQTRHQWELGDILIRLTDEYGMTIRAIAQRFNQEKSTLCDYKNTAKAFPIDQRDYSIPFEHYRICLICTSKTSREMEKLTKKAQPPVDLAAALQRMEKATTPKGKPITTAKEATTFFINEARNLIKPPIAEGLKLAYENPNLINNFHNADCVELLKRFPLKSIKIANLDPPYGAYRKTNDCKHDMSTTAAATKCSNETGPEAIKTTVDVLKALPPYLADGGVILLWQAATTALRLPILQAIEDVGMEVHAMIVWDKGRVQMGDYASAYTIQTEILYVIAPKGRENKPLNYDNSASRKTILTGYEIEDDDTSVLLSFKPIRQMKASIEEKHAFEKPIDMMEFLIKKHSWEGELVADLYGCRGSCCIAAHNLGRNWVYSELHPDNFELGSRRIYEHIQESAAKTA